MIRKLSLVILSLIMLQPFLAGSLQAASQDYILVNQNRIPIPETYILTQTIYNPGDIGGESGFFKEPQDIFVNGQGYIYIADTGNNRIVKLSAEGKMAGIYKGPAEKPLRSPEGVFADETGDVFIADTGNSRIVHLSAEGEFIEEFLKPDSDLLSDIVSFSPSKLSISSTGYIYVLRGQNILIMDANNRFRGFLGQTAIGFNLLDSLLRTFASEEQKRKLAKRNASVYTNITIDKTGAIYTTSRDPEKEIKKLNFLGKDLYTKKDPNSLFGEYFDWETGLKVIPLFTDLTVDDEGIITGIEQNLGKLYQYDQNGNVLTVFGGKGVQKGTFTIPVSIEHDRDGRILVLDRVMGSIQIFEPTRFIKLVHQAVSFYAAGEYNEAYDKWLEVLAVNEEYHHAHQGLADSLYKQGKWKEAMVSYKLANDRNGYSKAFVEYRYSIFRQYFLLVVFRFLLAAFMLVWLIKGARRLSDSSNKQITQTGGQMGLLNGLAFSMRVIFHPLQTFDQIINSRGKLNYLSGWIILAAALAVRIIYLMNVHYPLEDVGILDSNIWLEAVKLLVPPLTWVLASFFISSVWDGESRAGEIFMAACYCMVPYVLIVGILAFLSNMLTKHEAVLYHIIYYGVWVWILLLFFLSLKILNDYTLFKSLAAYAASGATMVLVWFIGLLWYVLSGRLYQFIGGVIHEVRMTWF